MALDTAEMGLLRRELLPALRGQPVEVVWGAVPHQGRDMHHAFEVTICLAGRLEKSLEGYTTVAGAGDVHVVPAWEPHGWRSLTPIRLEVVVHFLPEFLGEEEFGGMSWLAPFAVRPEDRPRLDDPDSRRQAMEAGRAMWQEYEERGFAWQEMVRLHILRVLGLLLRDWSRGKAQASSGKQTNLSRVMPAVELVHSRPSRRVSLEEAARVCGFSPAHFHKVFRGTLGVTFGRFALHSRLHQTAHLLLHTTQPIDAIARQTGFADGSHLHRAFVKTYQCTPADYRRRP